LDVFYTGAVATFFRNAAAALDAAFGGKLVGARLFEEVGKKIGSSPGDPETASFG
jgi:hypothetical protein